ncbi:type II toxin-antitoxin system HipA family toxin [Hyphomonas sp.]|uniref:type II toxin-antitoxin system HipA family toxin n=1 Tax=Hyphomonas sp. TaxID=87 RepID=UPI0025C51296|nr:type II toxin-antitoxin system HipA family toxin [Hyphomonas sp.]MBI1400041.1 type II toxin-antitoxin system HipA family toxin [Hyphomonas sp.]
MSQAVPVWFDSLHVGDVTVAEDGALGFAYTSAWLATQGAFPLSLTLPLRQAPYPSDVISPWLANLLPEEEQLSILTRSLGLDRSDTLAILNEIGGDTAGALSFGAPCERAAWTYTPLTEFYQEADPEAALERHFDDLQQRPFLVGEDGVRLSLAGGQKKSALAVLDASGTPVLRVPADGDVLAVPRHGAPSTLILKPDNPILPGIVENETYCLRLAQAVGIPAAEASILPAGKRKAICVLRYDRRIGRSGALQRVHQEDFAQANGIPPGRKYERGTRPGPDLATLLRTGRHLPPTDALSLLDQTIFNILAANTDAHAKNYSLLLPVGSEPRLAPLYDVSTVLTWPNVVQYFAQNIAGKRRKPSDLGAHHWDAIAVTVSYRPADVRERVREIVDQCVAQRAGVTKAVKALPGSAAGYVEQAAGCVEENALRIAGRLRKAR